MADTRAKDACKDLIGKRGPATFTPTEVTVTEIWDFMNAIEDPNPIYWDPDVAKASKFGRVVSPPQMTMRGGVAFMAWIPEWLREQRESEAGEGEENPSARVTEIIRGLGYTTLTNVEREDLYFEMYGPGDGRLKTVGYTEDVSEEKMTRVGPGIFITSVSEARTEHGDRLVSRTRNKLMMYDGTRPGKS